MSIEIEDKFDVPEGFEIPDLTGLGDVSGPRSFELVARYFDTPDLRLASRGITLRRRRGGSDAGWHLKLPEAKGARQEITRPLTRSARIVPPDLAELVRAYTRGAGLQPVAELVTRRSVTVLRTGDTRLVEIADDRVTGTAFGAQPVRWREVEAELLDGDERVLAQVGKRLRKAGATASASSSKLARLLDPPPAPDAGLDPGTAGHAVLAYLAGQLAALLSQDPRVRQAEADAVHQMRVASRRLRSALKAFKAIVRDTGALQEELRWLGTVLGEARDLEVMRARLGGELDRLAPESVVGPVRTRLHDDLLAREREAYERIRDALSGSRYYALLDALDALVARPALGKAAAKPAEARLSDVARANWQRVVRAYDTARAIDDPERRAIAMHEVRKAAKRARYTAEALTGTLGKPMAKLARRAEAVQEVLGVHQDGVVAQETLVREARAAREAGEDTFTYGLLMGLERAAAERAHAEFPGMWAETVAAIQKIPSIR